MRESERRSHAHQDHRLLRVSTDKQADRGVSLDAQRAKLKAYAELYELELVEIIVDAGQSAKSLDRPGLQRALAMLKEGEAEALLVVKLDRVTRSVVDLGTDAGSDSFHRTCSVKSRPLAPAVRVASPNTS